MWGGSDDWMVGLLGRSGCSERVSELGGLISTVNLEANVFCCILRTADGIFWLFNNMGGPDRMRGQNGQPGCHLSCYRATDTGNCTFH